MILSSDKNIIGVPCTRHDYSQVPNKRVYLINEYRIKIPKMLNEYDLINEYTGKFHNFSKRVWPIYKQVKLKVPQISAK